SVMEGMMTREQALRFLPLITAFFVFILMGNALAMVPGMLPPTDNLNTTAALGIIAFCAYNWWGIQQQGLVAHVGHLFGPVWWLSWLIFPIEVISHLVRPASLALRLAGNMFGDHKVLGIFLGFQALGFVLVPLPVMILGTVVIIVQAVVFTLLTIVYISMAVEEHGDHHDGEHGASAH
ncbi:MAG: F0F1 ATP synthase subunit A, partial [Myxococcota bacterium]|nr:F0F1 ATP synthase subunit A [Myxococcota bacterium]